MSRVFISHASQDKEKVRRLGDELRAAGHRPWLDNDEILPGDNIIRSIERGFDECSFVIVCLSHAAQRSGRVRAELESALMDQLARSTEYLILVRFDSVELPALLKSIAYADLFPDESSWKAGIKRVLQKLERGRLALDIRPQYPDSQTRELAEQLEELSIARAESSSRGDDTRELDTRIRDLKRHLRAGVSLKAGDSLSRFQLLQPLKSGGLASVWRAYDRQTEGVVAVKILHPQYARDQTAIDRFFRGARQMAKLRHPAIVRVVYQPGVEEGGYYFFAMDYLSGGDLWDAVRERRITRAKAIEITVKLGDALQYAHEKGLVHRDVKPQNVLLDLNENPYLTDFDLVRAADTTGRTRSGPLGTVLYAAPETWTHADQADARADQYSLAMTLLMCLYGEDLPLSALRETSAFVDELLGTSSLASVLKRALALEPIARYPSIRIFCDAVRAEQEGLEGQSTGWMAGGVAEIEPELVLVPAGPFVMGSPEDDPIATSVEKPMHRVDIPAYRIARFLITNAQYAQCCRESGEGFPPHWEGRTYPEAKDNHPIVNVTWFYAIAYCKWLRDRTGRNYRLPTEEQWEKAARHCEEQGRSFVYPWGDSWDATKCNNSENGIVETTPVGRYSPSGDSPYGVADMAGNAWEWCRDWFVGSKYARRAQKEVNDTTADPPRYRVLRGGGFDHDRRYVRSAARGRNLPQNSNYNVGFRVVLLD